MLDIGCGSGKYARLLAPLVNKYYALDASKTLISLAMKKSKQYDNIKFVNAPAQKIPLSDNSVDIVLSTWCISTIQHFTWRREAISEGMRVLKKNGVFIIVENAVEGGEWPKICGFDFDWREYEYQEWLTKDKGFSSFRRIGTNFEFNSLKSARQVVGFIFSSACGKRVENKVIKHNVVIFCKKKE